LLTLGVAHNHGLSSWLIEFTLWGVILC